MKQLHNLTGRPGVDVGIGAFRRSSPPRDPRIACPLAAAEAPLQGHFVEHFRRRAARGANTRDGEKRTPPVATAGHYDRFARCRDLRLVR